MKFLSLVICTCCYLGCQGTAFAQKPSIGPASLNRKIEDLSYKDLSKRCVQERNKFLADRQIDPADSIEVWLRAFIPNNRFDGGNTDKEISYITNPGTATYSATDQRLQSKDRNVTSRLNLRIIFDKNTEKLLDVYAWSDCTFHVDPRTSAIVDYAREKPQLSFEAQESLNVHINDLNETRVSFNLIGNHPLLKTAIIGPIRIAGSVSFSPKIGRITVVTYVSDYPAFEAFVWDAEHSRMVFAVYPPEDKTVTSLVSWAGRPVNLIESSVYLMDNKNTQPFPDSLLRSSIVDNKILLDRNDYAFGLFRDDSLNLQKEKPSPNVCIDMFESYKVREMREATFPDSLKRKLISNNSVVVALKGGREVRVVNEGSGRERINTLVENAVSHVKTKRNPLPLASIKDQVPIKYEDSNRFKLFELLNDLMGDGDKKSLSSPEKIKKQIQSYRSNLDIKIPKISRSVSFITSNSGDPYARVFYIDRDNIFPLSVCYFPIED